MSTLAAIPQQMNFTSDQVELIKRTVAVDVLQYVI